ncbi:MAG: hypothetical protein IPJ85_10870 [Flavobacteriales bacterium]|nr:hypothetical protein [Flavobacteriales bacterium]
MAARLTVLALKPASRCQPVSPSAIRKNIKPDGFAKGMGVKVRFGFGKLAEGQRFHLPLVWFSGPTGVARS